MDPEKTVWTLLSLLNMESPKVQKIQKVSHWLSKHCNGTHAFYRILTPKSPHDLKQTWFWMRILLTPRKQTQALKDWPVSQKECHNYQVIQAVTFWSPSCRSLNHPKKVTKNCHVPRPSVRVSKFSPKTGYIFRWFFRGTIFFTPDWRIQVLLFHFSNHQFSSSNWWNKNQGVL